jgi:hypothetical protein
VTRAAALAASPRNAERRVRVLPRFRVRSSNALVSMADRSLCFVALSRSFLGCLYLSRDGGARLPTG